MCLVCKYVVACVFACWCVYEGVAPERLFYLLSHGCHRNGRAGPAVAHGIQISLCISRDLMWKHHWGGRCGALGVNKEWGNRLREQHHSAIPGSRRAELHVELYKLTDWRTGRRLFMSSERRDESGTHAAGDVEKCM